MKPIKTTIERAKDAAKVWNEYRQRNMGKRFTKSQFMYDRLPYSGVAPKFLLETDLYLKPVDSINNGKVVYYEFTDHPIHYSVFEKAINRIYQIGNKHKFEAKNGNVDENKNTDQSTVSNHKFEDCKLSNKFHDFINITDHDLIDEVEARNLQDLIIGGMSTKEIYQKICDRDDFNNNFTVKTDFSKIPDDEFFDEFVERHLISKYNKKELLFFLLGNDLEDELTNFYAIHDKTLVNVLRRRGCEVTAKKTIEF